MTDGLSTLYQDLLAYCFGRDTAGLFLIVQSSSTISIELISRQLNPYLPIKQPVMASLTHRLRSLWEDIQQSMGYFLRHRSERRETWYGAGA